MLPDGSRVTLPVQRVAAVSLTDTRRGPEDAGSMKAARAAIT